MASQLERLEHQAGEVERREAELLDQADELAKRPWCILANKMDLPGAAENLAHLKTRFPKVKIMPVSAHDGTGIDARRTGTSQRNV